MLKSSPRAVLVSVITLVLFITTTFTCGPKCYSPRTGACHNVTIPVPRSCPAVKANWRKKCSAPMTESLLEADWLLSSGVTVTFIRCHRERDCARPPAHPSALAFSMTKVCLVPVQRQQIFSRKSDEWQRDAPEHRPGSHFVEDRPLCSSAPASPWSHSLYALVHPLTGGMLPRDRRHSPTQHKNIRSLVKPPPFGLTFRKCAQVEVGLEFPRVTIYLLINNTGTPAGAHLTQLSVRDTVSGLSLLENHGKVLEKGFLTFAEDSLSAGFHYSLNYSAIIRAHRDEILELPAYLTFSNASQNDINLFGPVVANLTIRINSTEKVYPNHGIHFAGFLGSFTSVVFLGLLLIHRLYTVARRNTLQQRRRAGVLNGDPDPEYAVCNISETAKEEAAFEDKIVDIMVLEDPQNMRQALENLHMSDLLRAAAGLESSRVQIHKDLAAALLRGPRLQGQLSAQAEGRLLGVLHGQLMGMEGKLKEEHVARVAALAAQCGLETREEMEAEHRRQAAQKALAERLLQQAPRQLALECSMLLDKLHELDQDRLRRGLLARHEEASARVQRQAVVQRRAELHKIFSEELEEATRMGEMDRGVANGLLHTYFTCQDQLEEVLDVFLANQRSVLGERHAQRQFLVHSLQSLKSLMCEVFAKTSAQMESWFRELRKKACVAEEQLEQLLEKAKKELLLVKQGLDEVLTQERSSMHCELVKKRRGLISDKLQEHKRKQKELSALGRVWAEGTDLAPYLLRWHSLLTSQCLELGELINNLDEEAAADIRKVTMRAIHSSMVEVKAILPEAAGALLGPGSTCFLPQREPVGAALAEAQERLHGEGKAAQRLLQATRDDLQHCLEQELHEQRELRLHARGYFQTLCASQLTLSEEELLRLKLAFQNCLSQMDHCLVLPRAHSRCRLQALLSQWRREQLLEKRTQPFGLPVEERWETCPSELLALRKQTETQLQIYEQEEEEESTAMKKVLEEMRLEREEELQVQEEDLAVQAAVVHFQRAEKRTRALETYGAILKLQGHLVEEMRPTGALGAPEVAQSIRNHRQGLEEADLLLQRERTEWEALATGNPESDDILDKAGENGMFHVEEDCRISVGLQEALRMCEQVTRALTERLRDENERSQVIEDLKEQLELKGIYTHLDQELDFMAGLLKRTQVSAGTLLETLGLLLPTSPEADLLSLVDVLYPRQSLSLAAAERDRGWADGTRAALLSRLRDDIIRRNILTPPQGKERERILKKRQSLLEKLFSPPRAESSGSTHQILVEEKPLEVSGRPSVSHPNPTSISEREIADARQASGQDMEVDVSVSTQATQSWDPSDTEGKVFVFKLQPEVTDLAGTAPKKERRKKRNYLNFKKGAVAPQEEE
ncbi:limbin-like isoform X2 [Brienomyrus brachyistius]|uniref:limbin-like isoform X2 n=1 Tax=Brienomyrus brachyistius TaxID=42636 RepID=UPI0020B43E4C|nr:limbin-like isoform X2 [Brienomyrus brachyistius]